jgi:hypothetical protein
MRLPSGVMVTHAAQSKDASGSGGRGRGYRSYGGTKHFDNVTGFLYFYFALNKKTLNYAFPTLSNKKNLFHFEVSKTILNIFLIGSSHHVC